METLGIHYIVRSEREIRLVHPSACALHLECKEGEFERSDGLEKYDCQEPDTFPVEWVDHGFDVTGEYLGGDLERIEPPFDPDYYYPDPTYTPSHDGPVRGFPYSGGRWSA